jgi:uncharacterized low-complexity protein
MISLRRTAAVVVAALSLTLGALAAPASAATLTNQSVSPGFAACAVTAFGYTGEKICGTGNFTTLNTSSGVDESFLIGLDWSIWHDWPGSNGWHSLGGQALHVTSNSVNPVVINGVFAVETIGTDGFDYCRVWPWTSGWFQCVPA